jgi:hypothetical protein
MGDLISGGTSTATCDHGCHADLSDDAIRAELALDRERAQRRYEAARDSALPMGFPPC